MTRPATATGRREAQPRSERAGRTPDDAVTYAFAAGAQMADETANRMTNKAAKPDDGRDCKTG
jgi:hypothetical protein